MRPEGAGGLLEGGGGGGQSEACCVAAVALENGPGPELKRKISRLKGIGLRGKYRNGKVG